MFAKLRNSIFFVLVFGFTLTACENSWESEHPLMGAWVINKSLWNGQDMELPKPRSMKIYSKEHVIYTYYDFQINGEAVSPEEAANIEPKLAVGLGTYKFNGSKLTEFIINHSYKNLIGQTFTFEPELRSSGNLFYQKVKIGDDILEETWYRAD
ncbi:MAG: hypothetical protein ACPGGG_08320 [Parvibaculales bacterium]